MAHGVLSCMFWLWVWYCQNQLCPYFPKIPHYARSLYHGVIQPQSTSQHLKVSESRPLIIFWSQYGNPSIATDSLYKPNHVVPLVASEAGEQDRHVNEIEQNADDHPSTSVSKTKVKSKRSGKTNEQSNLNKQGRISTFFQKEAMISAHTHSRVNIPPPNTARRPDSDERSAQLLINRPSSASTDERSDQLLTNRPSSASTDERSDQLLTNRPSSASTDERSAQLLINRPSSASTDERSAQLLINRPSSASQGWGRLQW